MSRSVPVAVTDHHSYNDMQDTDNCNVSNRQDVVVFVTAHPDDESMFFVPSIVGLGAGLCFALSSSLSSSSSSLLEVQVSSTATKTTKTAAHRNYTAHERKHTTHYHAIKTAQPQHLHLNT